MRVRERNILMTFNKKCNLLVRALVCVLFSVCCYAGSDTTCSQDRTLTGFDALISWADSDQKTVDTEKFSPILDYVSSNETDPYPDCQSVLDGAPIAYYGFGVHGGLDRLIRYYFNPEIPTYAVMPNMIRVSSWRNLAQGTSTDLPRLWTRLNDFKDPLVSHSAYYMENTPDPSTGAYYGYDSYRMIILTRYKGRTALISIMKQKDVSDVGRKGFIVGDKKDMDYFYSGEQGLNLLGLGWVKSYLYDSFSVAVFIENNDGQGLRCGIFKWLRAGWAGRNMVRKTHILDGLKRYASVFTRLMDADDFPAPAQLAEICSMYNGLPSSELKKKMEDHLLSLQGKCACESGCPKPLRKHFDMNRYIDNLSPMEMKAALVVDDIKHLLFKEETSGHVAYQPKPDDTPVF
jgi:hypothetical protein